MQQLELPFPPIQYDPPVNPSPVFQYTPNIAIPHNRLQENLIQKEPVKYVIREGTGVKHDQQKVRPTLLFKSLKQPLDEVLAVLEFGAKKYAPDNWKHVEGHRYDDALLRHVQAYLGGEMNDPETGLHHLAHAACCILFKIYLDKNPK